MAMNLALVSVNKMKENLLCAILASVTIQFGKARTLIGLNLEIWLIVIQKKSSQDIDSVILAAENVKVMNAKIVAKINQEGSDIQSNRTLNLVK